MNKLDCKHDRLARTCTECEAEATITDLHAKLQAAEMHNGELVTRLFNAESRAEAAEAASAFLLRLTLEGGRIVSTASIKSVEIATAFNEGRMFVDRRHYGYVIVPEAAPQEIPESGGHIESADCWCGPTVEEHPGGTLIIHNQTH